MISVKTKIVSALALACSVLGCNVESTGGDTGGLGGMGGAGNSDSRCPPGVAVVLSDYLSTQIALADLWGNPQSASLISTASSETQGLAFALSGDVSVASTPPPQNEVILLDRYGTNAITWISPSSGRVRTQLAVGTGFESNPQDLIQVSDELAFVSRWGINANAGSQPYDRGDDVLVIDPSAPQITGAIPMPTTGDFPARPGPLLRTAEDEIMVMLERVALDFSGADNSMLVGISIEDQQVEWQHTLQGHKGCGRPALSPDGSLLAVACSGRLQTDGLIEDIDQSALLLFNAHQRPLQEVAHYPAEEIAGEPLQGSVAFASQQLVVLKTQTPLGGNSHNRWLSFDIETRRATTLLEASPDLDGKGKGLVYGGMACFPGCTDTCLLADADASVLQRARLDDDQLVLLSPVQVEDSVGLPPISLAPR